MRVNLQGFPIDRSKLHLKISVTIRYTDFDGSEVAATVILQAESAELKKEVAELVFENNRYDFAISNCTFCASDDAGTSDASLSSDESLKPSERCQVLGTEK